VGDNFHIWEEQERNHPTIIWRIWDISMKRRPPGRIGGKDWGQNGMAHNYYILGEAGDFVLSTGIP
jgi:hypothetical protein